MVAKAIIRNDTPFNTTVIYLQLWKLCQIPECLWVDGGILEFVCTEKSERQQKVTWYILQLLEEAK